MNFAANTSAATDDDVTVPPQSDQIDAVLQPKAQWAAYLAIAFGLLAFMPALARIYERGKACDISFPAIMLRACAGICWLIYAHINMFQASLMSSWVAIFLLIWYGAAVWDYSRECVSPVDVTAFKVAQIRGI